MSSQESDPETITLEMAQTGLLASLGDLAKGRRAKKMRHQVTFVETFGALSTTYDARELYDMDTAVFHKKFAPQDQLCAPLTPVFKTVGRELETSAATQKSLIIFASLLDLTNEMCHGGSKDGLFTDGVKDEYGFDAILQDTTLTSLYLIEVWTDKKPVFNAYIQEHKHSGLHVEFLTLEDVADGIDAKLRRPK